jgi:hypothetical protein
MEVAEESKDSWIHNSFTSELHDRGVMHQHMHDFHQQDMARLRQGLQQYDDDHDDLVMRLLQDQVDMRVGGGHVSRPL